jgi:hypothetical protein
VNEKIRVNKFPGRCGDCGQQVGAGLGVLRGARPFHKICPPRPESTPVSVGEFLRTFQPYDGDGQ